MISSLGPDSITYQWYEGDKAIQGANKASYIIPQNKGVTSTPINYHCVVTSGNATAKSGTAKVTIGKRTASLQIKGSLVYNGKDQQPTIVVGNLVSGDTCEVTANVAGEHKNASTSYRATVTDLSNPNYALPSNPTLDYTISKKTINLAWSPNPCTFPYSGLPQAPAATTSGFAPEDAGKVQISISVPGDHKAAGTYTATATLTGASAGNYDVSDPTQTFTITSPAPADKSTLETLLTTTTKYYDSIKSSYADIAATLQKAIDAAKDVYDRSDATTQEVTNAVSALTSAYNAATNEVDAAAAQAVAAKISMLPKAADVTLDDADKIAAARVAYSDLTASQKDRIDAKTLQKLTDAEAALKALEKPTLKIYPIGNEKEYGDDDPDLGYWIEEVGSNSSRVRSTESKSDKYKIRGRLIREDGEARGSYKVKKERDMDRYEKAETLRSDKYTIKIMDGVALTIKAKTLTSSMISLTPSQFTYTGSARKLESVTVWNGSTRLEQDRDYIIESSSVLSATGSASQNTSYAVKITGRKNYTGTATKTWTILKSGATTTVPSSSVKPSSTAQPTSTAQPSSTSAPTSTAQPTGSEPEVPSSSSEGSTSGTTDSAHLTSVNTGMAEEALRKLADSTRLKDAENALQSVVGESELKALRNEGKEPEVQLTTKAMKVVSENEKKLAESSMADASESLTPAAYLDINLSVETTGTWQTVTQTKKPIEVTIDVPEEFQKLSKKFYFLRIHEGVASLLFDKDEDPKTITVDSDQFSTYVLMYPGKSGANTPAAAAKNRTGIVIWILVGIAVVALLLILLIFYRRTKRRHFDD